MFTLEQRKSKEAMGRMYEEAGCRVVPSGHAVRIGSYTGSHGLGAGLGVWVNWGRVRIRGDVSTRVGTVVKV